MSGAFIPRHKATRPQYATGADEAVLRGENPRYVLAYQFRPVDLAGLPCTCFAQGVCKVCQYWLSAGYARSIRRAW